MSEATRKKMVFGLLVVAMIWGAYNIDFGKKKVRPEPIHASAPTAATSTAPVAPAAIDVEKETAQSWGEDPFRVVVPDRSRPKQTPSWNLGGIIYNATSPLAIINNQTVGVGDKVGGATVVNIDRTLVTLDHNGSFVTLRVASKG